VERVTDRGVATGVNHKLYLLQTVCMNRENTLSVATLFDLSPKAHARTGICYFDTLFLFTRAT